MNRRELMKLTGAGMMAAPHVALPGRMKLGTQHTTDPAALRVLAALGVTHICSGLPSTKLDESWSVDGLKRLKDRVEAAGVQLAMVPLPLSSSIIDKAEMPSILLGQSPERDKASGTQVPAARSGPCGSCARNVRSASATKSAFSAQMPCHISAGLDASRVISAKALPATSGPVVATAASAAFIKAAATICGKWLT